MSSEIPSSGGPVMSFSDVGKFYPMLATPVSMLRYLAPGRVRARPSDFWALRNISFSIRRGTTLGIIGRNGSGKSTLLQLAAGLLKPSEGRIEVRGRTAALIELGAGFNPEFTGRENAMLNGAIYGYTKQDMEAKIEDIIDFAGIRPFMDKPVKTYSSGMYARLAFAVAIQVDPDILIVDEILSVGDLEFQAKCFRKIESLRNGGASIMFVTHNMHAVQSICDHAMFLDRGACVFTGSPKDTVEAYMTALARTTAGEEPSEKVPAMPAAQRAHVADLVLLNSRGEETKHPSAGEKCRVRYRVRFNDGVNCPVVNLQLKTMMGMVVYDYNSASSKHMVGSCGKGDELEVTVDLTMNLCPGAYRVGVGVSDIQGNMPVPLFGAELLAIEVLSGKPAYGVAFLDASMAVEHRRAGA